MTKREFGDWKKKQELLIVKYQGEERTIKSVIDELKLELYYDSEVIKKQIGEDVYENIGRRVEEIQNTTYNREQLEKMQREQIAYYVRAYR